jgi:hypothetical protein
MNEGLVNPLDDIARESPTPLNGIPFNGLGHGRLRAKRRIGANALEPSRHTPIADRWKMMVARGGIERKRPALAVLTD